MWKTSYFVLEWGNAIRNIYKNIAVESTTSVIYFTPARQLPFETDSHSLYMNNIWVDFFFKKNKNPTWVDLIAIDYRQLPCSFQLKNKNVIVGSPSVGDQHNITWKGRWHLEVLCEITKELGNTTSAGGFSSLPDCSVPNERCNTAFRSKASYSIWKQIGDLSTTVTMSQVQKEINKMTYQLSWTRGKWLEFLNWKS